jgi:hypothetical protein
VLEWAQSQGMVKLGRVAIDSTRIAANASEDRVDTEQALRDTRARLRRQVREWQKQADLWKALRCVAIARQPSSIIPGRLCAAAKQKPLRRSIFA